VQTRGTPSSGLGRTRLSINWKRVLRAGDAKREDILSEGGVIVNPEYSAI
jgi:hypothetical protein